MLAFAAEIVAGKDATMSRFNTNRMRAFLIEAFEQSEISSFPTTGGCARLATEPEVLHLVM